MADDGALDRHIAALEKALIEESTRDELHAKAVAAKAAVGDRTAEIVAAFMDGIAPVIRDYVAGVVLPVAISVKKLRPALVDAGDFEPGRGYAAGNGVSYKGSYWIAQRETAVAPSSLGSNTDWRLAVQRGRDGLSINTRIGANGKVAVNSLPAIEARLSALEARPALVDAGVFEPGRTYAAGNGVTHQGSYWLAQCETAVTPGGNADWRLAVKRGRDGRTK